MYDIFKNLEHLERNRQTNAARIQREGDGTGWHHSQLTDLVKATEIPHRFYCVNLKESCYQIFDRDHVWPASLLTSVGRMAGGDRDHLLSPTPRNVDIWETASTTFTYDSSRILIGSPMRDLMRCRPASNSLPSFA